MYAIALEPQLAHSNPQALFSLCRLTVMLQNLDRIIHFMLILHVYKQKNIQWGKYVLNM